MGLIRQAIDRHIQEIAVSSLTFGEFTTRRFLPEYPAAKGLAPSTVASYQYLLGRLALPEIGHLPIGEVTAGAVARLLGRLRDQDRAASEDLRDQARAARPIAAATIDGAATVLERLLSWAAGQGLPPDTRTAAAGELFVSRSDLAPSSRRLYRQHLRRRIAPTVGDLALGAIDDAAIVRMRAQLATATRPTPPRPGARTRTGRLKAAWEIARDGRRGGTRSGPARLSPQTLRHLVVAIKAVLTWAERVRELHRAPELTIPRVPRPQLAAPYSRTEAQRLVAAAGSAMERAAYLLAFDTGLRKSELLGLTWSQVDWERRTILLDRQRYRGHVRQTKSGRERTVPMSKVVLAALERARHARGATVLADGGGQPLSEDQLRTLYERTVERAGLRKIPWHRHRHTFSTLRTDAGTSPFALQALLGHADVRTTQGYVHASGEEIGSVMDQISKGNR